MLIGASEGRTWRYEVVERTEGFLVRMRDLGSGGIDEEESRVFRTAAVAFAYAEMSAAFERCASATMAGEDAAEASAELEATKALYGDLSRRLGDDGIAAQLIVAWERQSEASDRRRYH